MIQFIATFFITTVGSPALVDDLISRFQTTTTSMGLEQDEAGAIFRARPVLIDCTLTDASKKLQVHVLMHEVSTEREKREAKSAYTDGSGRRATLVGLFEVGVGDASVATEHVGSYRTSAVGDRFVVDVRATCGDGISSTATIANRDAARTASDRICRILLGDAMSLGLNDDGNRRPDFVGSAIDGRKDGYVPLASWAQTRGGVVSFATEPLRALVSFNGKLLQLPLSSSRVGVNGRDRELGGKFILARGDRWFIPKAELEEAIDNG